MSIARYHEGSRRLQDRFDTRRIADRLDEARYTDRIADDRRAFIEECDHFFLATADAEGRPDCSYKGGLPGFVRVTSPAELAWPDYDGNGQFRSLGNLLVNPNAGLLFVNWKQPRRLRVNGTVRVVADDPLLGTWPGAQLVVRLTVAQVFPNCPRYIHRVERVETSVYVPREGEDCPRPAWKDDPALADALPERDRHPPR